MGRFSRKVKRHNIVGTKKRKKLTLKMLMKAQKEYWKELKSMMGTNSSTTEETNSD